MTTTIELIYFETGGGHRAVIIAMLGALFISGLTSHTPSTETIICY